MREELERVGLAAEAKRKPRQLSGGQQQRVALARALINRPAVLLLDEPLGALDLKLRKGLQVELKRIQREVGITFVYVTHDQEEALTMSDRIAVMNRGVIEQLASAGGGVRAAAHRVRGRLHRRLEPAARAGRVGRTATRWTCASTAARPCARRGPASRAGTAATPSCGPEKLQVARVEEPAPAGQPSVEGVVESAVYLGTATQMVVKLAGDVRLTVLVPNADEAERQQLPGAGARVRLAWAPEHMHIVAGERRPGAGRPADDERRPDTVPAAGMSRNRERRAVSDSNDWDIERALDAMRPRA